MAAVYENNFGYYDLEADPDEAAFRFRQKPEQAATMLALLRAGPKRGHRPVGGLR
jgi:hypothetical protein